jgi:hypothetical protein
MINFVLFDFFTYRNHHRNRGFALEQMDRLDDTTFKRMFRVDRQTFDEILYMIEPIMVERDAARPLTALVGKLVLRLGLLLPYVFLLVDHILIYVLLGGLVTLPFTVIGVLYGPL